MKHKRKITQKPVLKNRRKTRSKLRKVYAKKRRATRKVVQVGGVSSDEYYTGKYEKYVAFFCDFNATKKFLGSRDDRSKEYFEALPGENFEATALGWTFNRKDKEHSINTKKKQTALDNFNPENLKYREGVPGRIKLSPLDKQVFEFFRDFYMAMTSPSLPPTKEKVDLLKSLVQSTVTKKDELLVKGDIFTLPKSEMQKLSKYKEFLKNWNDKLEMIRTASPASATPHSASASGASASAHSASAPIASAPIASATYPSATAPAASSVTLTVPFVYLNRIFVDIDGGQTKPYVRNISLRFDNLIKNALGVPQGTALNIKGCVWRMCGKLPDDTNSTKFCWKKIEGTPTTGNKYFNADKRQFTRWWCREDRTLTVPFDYTNKSHRTSLNYEMTEIDQIYYDSIHKTYSLPDRMLYNLFLIFPRMASYWMETHSDKVKTGQSNFFDNLLPLETDHSIHCHTTEIHYIFTIRRVFLTYIEDTGRPYVYAIQLTITIVKEDGLEDVVVLYIVPHGDPTTSVTTMKGKEHVKFPANWLDTALNLVNEALKTKNKVIRTDVNPNPVTLSITKDRDGTPQQLLEPSYLESITSSTVYTLVKNYRQNGPSQSNSLNIDIKIATASQQMAIGALLQNEKIQQYYRELWEEFQQSDWKPVQVPQGRPYYFNEKTHETAWQRPPISSKNASNFIFVVTNGQTGQGNVQLKLVVDKLTIVDNITPGQEDKPYIIAIVNCTPDSDIVKEYTLVTGLYTDVKNITAAMENTHHKHTLI